LFFLGKTGSGSLVIGENCIHLFIDHEENVKGLILWLFALSPAKILNNAMIVKD